MCWRKFDQRDVRVHSLIVCEDAFHSVALALPTFHPDVNCLRFSVFPRHIVPIEILSNLSLLFPIEAMSSNVRITNPLNQSNGPSVSVKVDRLRKIPDETEIRYYASPWPVETSEVKWQMKMEWNTSTGTRMTHLSFSSLTERLKIFNKENLPAARCGTVSGRHPLVSLNNCCQFVRQKFEFLLPHRIEQKNWSELGYS